MKKSLFAVILLSVLLCGCTQPPAGLGGEAPESPTPLLTPSPTPSLEATPAPEERLDLPIKITYVRHMYKGEEKEEEKFDHYVVYYLEREEECTGRDAIVGVLNAYNEGDDPKHTYWAKFTLYLDNGEFGSSGGIPKSELAFDDAEAKRPDYAVITQLNSMFAASGENLNSSNAWESDIPIILKDIYYAGSSFGDIMGDVSLIKKSTSSEHAVPCTEFSVNIKSKTSFTGETVYCLAGLDSEIGLPYTVSITIPEMKNNNDVELVKVEKASSGATFYPQCMEPVYCGKLNLMSEEEKEECKAQGNVVQQARDEQGCITGDECLDAREFIKKEIKKSQPPQCPEPSDEFIEEALKCVEAGTEPKSMEPDEQGCFISIDC